MKKNALFVLFALICLGAKTQSFESERNFLAVERACKTHKVIRVFKPGKLYIETKNGFNLHITDYSILENALILSQMDTVNFSEINRIRGKVYVKAGKKTAGFLISVLSIPASGMGAFITAWSYEVPFGAFPFFGTFF